MSLDELQNDAQSLALREAGTLIRDMVALLDHELLVERIGAMTECVRQDLHARRQRHYLKLRAFLAQHKTLLGKH